MYLHMAPVHLEGLDRDTVTCHPGAWPSICPVLNTTVSGVLYATRGGQPGSLPLSQPRDGPVENAGQFSTQFGGQVLVDFLFLESARTGGSQCGVGAILTVMLSDGGKPLSAVGPSLDLWDRRR